MAYLPSTLKTHPLQGRQPPEKRFGRLLIPANESDCLSATHRCPNDDGLLLPLPRGMFHGEGSAHPRMEAQIAVRATHSNAAQVRPGSTPCPAGKTSFSPST